MPAGLRLNLSVTSFIAGASLLGWMQPSPTLGMFYVAWGAYWAFSALVNYVNGTRESATAD